MPHITLDECPICHGPLQATVTQYFDAARTGIDAQGQPYMVEGDVQVQPEWRVYCANEPESHNWAEIIQTLRDKEVTP